MNIDWILTATSLVSSAVGPNLPDAITRRIDVSLYGRAEGVSQGAVQSPEVNSPNGLNGQNTALYRGGPEDCQY